MKRWFVFVLSLTLYNLANAQFKFRPEFDVPVKTGQTLLNKAWEGGLNSPQFQTIDLDRDGDLDLVLYHRISRDITTYLLEDNQYTRAPEYDQSFPKDTRSLFLLKDYDCDGRKDLFTSTSLGIKVYRNSSDKNGLKWSLASEFLTFDKGSNIQLAPSDIPGIADINGDGALDILTFRFGNANSIDLYLNTGNCGSLSFTRAERRWGDFEECGCNNFVFGKSCPAGGGGSLGGGLGEEVLRHIGGKTIVPFDADNDGDIDILSSDETCETLYFLENVGNVQEAQFTAVQSYPVQNPAGFPFFPSAFFEDVNHDGLKDLLIATNADENIGDGIELSKHIKVYPNIGSNETPSYNDKIDFIQNEMIDLGEDTYPSFVDVDGDGDFDLVVGNKGLIKDNKIEASLFLFENTGNTIKPEFTLQNRDFLGLAVLKGTFLKPQFIDMDNDQDMDLVYQISLHSNNTGIFFKENTGNFNFGPEQKLNIPTSTGDNPHFYDIDQDGDKDLLLGKQFGSMSLFLNKGDLAFAPEIPEFAGIRNDFKRLNLHIFVQDFDDNGISDLITTDLTGEVRVYRGPINQDFLATNPISNVYWLGNTKTTSRFGIQNAIAAADVFGTKMPSLILGSNKGGLQLLANISDNNSTSEEVILRVRPNPSQNLVLVLTNVTGTLEIYNNMGQRITERIPVIPGTDLPIDVGRFAAGTYIFKVISEQKQSKSTRVIIEK